MMTDNQPEVNYQAELDYQRELDSYLDEDLENDPFDENDYDYDSLESLIDNTSQTFIEPNDEI